MRGAAVSAPSGAAYREFAAVLVDGTVVSQNVDERQVVPLPSRVVVGVVRRGQLDRAWTAPPITTTDSRTLRESDIGKEEPRNQKTQLNWRSTRS